MKTSPLQSNTVGSVEKVTSKEHKTTAEVVNILPENLETIHIPESSDKSKSGARAINFLSDGRDMNLSNMILNIESNNSNNFYKPLDVYKIYSEMKEIDNSPEFRKSLENSAWAVKVPPNINNKLNELKQNEPKSFLVLPMLGKGHLWSTLIRKTDEGFSAIVVNKGLRFWHDPLEEFVFKNENKKKLIEALSYTGFGTAHSVEDVYRKFINNSDKQYNMKITASPQKVGNCFTKNIQAGIKLAYATRNIPSSQLRTYRINKPYTPYGTNDKDKTTFKWKDMSTEQMQKLFVKKVVEKNPNIRSKVAQSVEIYSANKHFRQKMETSKNSLENFIKGFDPENKSASMDMGKRIKYLLKDLTPYTYNKNKSDINNIVKSANNPDLNKQYSNLNKYTEYGARSMGNLYFHFYMEAKHDVMKSLETVFDKKGELKNTPPSQKAKILLEKLDPTVISIHKQKLMPVIGIAYGNENAEKNYNSLLEKSKVISSEHEKNKPSKQTLSEIASTFPIIVGQVNHRISKYSYIIAENLLFIKDQPKEALNLLQKSDTAEPDFQMSNIKGQCFHRLRNYKDAISEYTKAINLNPESPITYYYRAVSYEGMGNKIAAKADFDKAAKLSPEIKQYLQKENKIAVNGRCLERN
jgi:tetratricopeptide (TPR) repeat protein